MAELPKGLGSVLSASVDVVKCTPFLQYHWGDGGNLPAAAAEGYTGVKIFLVDCFQMDSCFLLPDRPPERLHESSEKPGAWC